jgi:hypothetical protein
MRRTAVILLSQILLIFWDINGHVRCFTEYFYSLGLKVYTVVRIYMSVAATLFMSDFGRLPFEIIMCHCYVHTVFTVTVVYSGPVRINDGLLYSFIKSATLVCLHFGPVEGGRKFVWNVGKFYRFNTEDSTINKLRCFVFEILIPVEDPAL